MRQDWRTIALRVNAILKEYPRLRLTHGRKVLEVRPVIDWNKGKAVEFLLDSLGENFHHDNFTCYFNWTTKTAVCRTIFWCF